MAFAAVLSMLGWTLNLFALAMLLPVIVALGVAEYDVLVGFVAAGLITIFIGGSLVIATRGDKSPVTRREGFVLAVVAWSVVPLFGALPLYFAGMEINYATAYFEALSGLTTTGASVLPNLEAWPNSVLLWRSEMQWIGGLGTIMLAVAILSLLKIGGLTLYRSGLPGSEQDTIAERLRRTIFSIWWIYAGLTMACAVALWFAGMTLLDAFCHAFSTLSTGGFSTREGSIASFDSVTIELIIAIFMVIGAINFTLHWAGAQGRLIVYRRDPEVRYLFQLIILAALVVTLGLVLSAVDGDLLSALGDGLFMAISSVSTTGYIGAGIADRLGNEVSFPPFLSILTIALILVGGCTGSTSGGIKLMRLSILIKQGGRELNRLVFPSSVIPLRFANRSVAPDVIRGVWSYFAIYLLCVTAISLGLGASGLSFRDAIAAATAAIGNSGPAAQLVAGDAVGGYHDLSVGAKIWVGFGMLLGRVELFALLILANPGFWRR